MNEPIQASRLDQIQTRWSLICRSGSELTTEAGLALHALALRYAPSIRRYVFAMTRDDDLADELAQDIVVRLLKGELSHADAEKGRFRDFLKTVIRNTVRNRWKRDARRTSTPITDAEQAEAELEENTAWDDVVKQHVLDSAWNELQQHEQRHPASQVHAALRLRVEHPQATSNELAQIATQQFGKPINPATIRQQIHRARQLMKQFIINEIADGLRDPDDQAIDEELAALGLKSWVE